MDVLSGGAKCDSEMWWQDVRARGTVALGVMAARLEELRPRRQERRGGHIGRGRERAQVDDRLPQRSERRGRAVAIRHLGAFKFTEHLCPLELGTLKLRTVGIERAEQLTDCGLTLRRPVQRLGEQRLGGGRTAGAAAREVAQGAGCLRGGAWRGA